MDDLKFAQLTRDLEALKERFERHASVSSARATQVLALAGKVERANEIQLLVRQQLTEIHAERSETRYALEHIGRQLAVLSKDVDDVERATREITGAHRLIEPEKTDKQRDPWYGRLLLGLANAPGRTQAFFVVALLVLLGGAVLIVMGGGVAAIVNALRGHAP